MSAHHYTHLLSKKWLNTKKRKEQTIRDPQVWNINMIEFWIQLSENYVR